MAKTIIGIMGPGDGATALDLGNAYEVGRLSALAGHVVMTGGRASGVMEAGLRGAKAGGGLTLGILPFKSKGDASPYVDIAVVTGLNSARNFVNALTSDIMVACGMESGTLSEVALALKDGKRVVLLTENERAKDFLADLNPGLVRIAKDPDDAMRLIGELLKASE